MSSQDWRSQGAEACRIYFAEHAGDVTVMCEGRRSYSVVKAIFMMALCRAAERTGTVEMTENNVAFSEGFVSEAITQIVILRGRVPIVRP